jgi:hypothetical protein
MGLDEIREVEMATQHCNDIKKELSNLTTPITIKLNDSDRDKFMRLFNRKPKISLKLKKLFKEFDYWK